MPEPVRFASLCRVQLCLLLFFAVAFFVPMNGLATPAHIIVADDKEYPPYSFLDSSGTPRGITIDIWKLWSEKTGIPVEFRLLEWETALTEVREGRANAVGGLFRTSEREAFFDFTPQRLSIPTAIFFHSSLGGIRGIQDLAGFNIGVVKGDSAEELVRRRHPSYTVTTFPGAHDLVQAASSGQIKVFIADSPTAGFYLAQFPEGAEFRQASDLIDVNPQYSAVRKGDHQTLAVIEAGFTKITKDELRAIEEDWSGRTLFLRFPWRQVAGGVAVLALGLGAILLWNLTLRRQVRAKTSELAKSMMDLRKSEAKYRILVENQTDLLVKVDAQGHLLYVSPSYCKTFSRSAEELLGTAFMSLVCEDGRDSTINAMKALNDPPHTAYIEQRVLTVDGWRWLAWNDSAILGPEGEIREIIGVGRDITDRKRLEMRLADQLAFQQALMETIPYAVFYKDAETRFVGCNTAYEETFGILREDFIGKRVLDLEYLPEKDRLEYQAEDEATIATLGRVLKEMAIPFADGLIHQTLYSVNGFRQADGTPGGLIGVIVDISDLKRAEVALRESEARYRSVIENIQDMFYRTDTHGRLVLLSPSTPRQLGYDSVEEVLGRPAADFWMQPELRQDFLLHIKAEGVVKDYEVFLKAKDGSPLLVSATSAYYHDDEGNVLGVEGIFRDITERKRAEEAVKKSRDELEERVADRTRELTEANTRLTELDNLKSAFLNTVSHDLRTPLTSILGFSKIIQRDFTRRFLPLTEGDKALRDRASKILNNLDVIVSEGERLTRLVSDFLDLSRIEEGRYTWKEKTTDMGVLIKDTVSSLKGALLEKHGVQIRVDMAPNLPELSVDPDRIAQVLTNLLSNAIKFTPEGTVTLAATANSESIRVTVADTGMGIPPDELPMVFDKFYQVGDDTLVAEKGTGLGLAICKQIVEHYNGAIWAESTLGVGSVFSFDLPLIS